MTISQNSKILASDINSFVTRLNNLWGTGTGNTGFLQTNILPTPVGKVQSTTFVDIINRCLEIADIKNVTFTQLPPISLFAVGNKIRATDINGSTYNLDNSITLLETSTGIDLTNYTLSPNISCTSRSTAWNTILLHEITVDFGTEDDARRYFNTGSQIRFSGDRTGGTVTPQNTSWTNLFNNIGYVTFSSDNTGQTGTGGVTTNIGYYDLTSTYQEIFRQNSNDSGYAMNEYIINARRENYTGTNGANGSLLRFQIILSDDYTGIGDNIDGIISHCASTFRLTSPFIVNQPTVTTVTNF